MTGVNNVACVRLGKSGGVCLARVGPQSGCPTDPEYLRVSPLAVHAHVLDGGEDLVDSRRDNDNNDTDGKDDALDPVGGHQRGEVVPRHSIPVNYTSAKHPHGYKSFALTEFLQNTLVSA